VRARRFAAGLSALAALAFAPAAASAHATLETTVPARGAQLASPPSEVAFRFDEAVNAGLGGVQVVDIRGRQVQSGGTFHPGGRGSEVAVRLPESLADGGYTATYRVISADSHPVAGGFTFTVGDATASARPVAGLLDAQRAGPVTSSAFAVARAVQYAAITLALGALAFLTACWWPGLAEAGVESGSVADEAFGRRLRVLLLAAGAGGLASALTGLVIEGALGQGTTAWQALLPSVIGEVLGTRFGVVWALAAGAWALLLLYATVLGRAPGRREAALLAAPVVPLALLPSLAGHTSVEPPVWLLLPANVVHVLAVSAWLGGIAVLVLAMRAATRRLEGSPRTRLLAAVVGRFSRLAAVAFAALLATGVAQAVVEVASVHALVDTAFGRAVLIKLVLFFALVGLGWTHRSRTLPALRTQTAGGATGSAGTLLRRLLRAELLIGIAALGVTGALAGYAPAKSVPAGPWSGSGQVGDAHLEVTVAPAAPGPNQVHLYLLDPRTGAQYTRAKELTVTAGLSERNIAALSLDTRRAGPGHYLATGTLGAPGMWRLDVTVRVSAFDENVARFSVPVR
jgi:copper transport protein